MFPTFDIFQQVFTDITEDYGILVIDNRIHSKNITDKVFWYKAKKVPHFSFGNSKFRNYHKSVYDKNWNKKLEVFNPEILLKTKKNSIKISVDKIK
jgi:hypothetical protein